MNPKEARFKPGIVGPGEEEIRAISQLELGQRKISRKKFITGAALMVMGFLAGCRPGEAREPTPEVTETTGIPPTPTLEITPTPTPEPTATPTPEPLPTVTPEAYREELKLALGGEWKEVRFGEEVVGYKIDNLQLVLPNWEVPIKNWDEKHFLIEKGREKIAPLVALAENQIAKFNQEGKIEIYQNEELTATLNPDISWAVTALSRDLVDEGKDLMVRIKQDPGAGEKPLVEAFERETMEIVKSSLPQRLRDVLPEGGGTVPDLEGQIKLAKEWTLFRPSERGDYEEIARWRAGEPVEPVIEMIKSLENWVYLPNVENVKFAGFNQEQLQMLKEAADLVKQYDPERFALFEKEIDWVILNEKSSYENRRIFESSTMFRLTTPRDVSVAHQASGIWGHEFQHRIQEMNGVDFSVVCRDAKLAEEVEIGKNGAYIAQKELLQKLRPAISRENQWYVDKIIANLDEAINGIHPVETCFH